MIPSPELQAKLAAWRAKAVAGTLTKEEMAEAVELMRKDRKVAAMVSEKSVATRVTKAKAVIPTADEMLAEIGFKASE